LKTIGKYQVVGLLGRGGMGCVYKVRLPGIDKIMALKLLAPQPALISLLGEEQIRDRFRSEAVTMGGLRHINIAAVWDYEESRQGTFFVMEYYCRNLGDLIGESYDLEAPSRLLSVDLAVDYIRQTLAGLHRLHAAGIVHRDIKPYNLLLTEDDTIKITDFGLSKLRRETSEAHGNLRIGSPYYTAPEQFEDPARASYQSDLYSVGVILHRLLTGLLTEADRTTKIPSTSGLDSQWDDFLQKTTAHDPRKRFSSAKEMMAALDKLARSWRLKVAGNCRLEPAAPKSPANGVNSYRRLRSLGTKVRPSEARDVFVLDHLNRPRAYHPHQYETVENKLVLDRATHLMWQISGVEFCVTWPEAKQYIDQLNRDAWCGQTDWRLPTVDELAGTLSRPERHGDYCQESVFDRSQKVLWSCDRRSVVAAWYVNTDLGFAGWQDDTCFFSVKAVRSVPIS
jgi:serine/threonine-protein kinase